MIHADDKNKVIYIFKINIVKFQDDLEEEFTITKWEHEYKIENPPPSIPDEVFEDIDNDLEAE